MSLPSSQERALNRIEGMMMDSDPRLMALFAIFTRLTRDEEMPRIEELRALLTRLRLWLSWHTAPIRRIGRQRSERIRTIVFVPVAALAAMSCALIIGMASHGAPRCWPASKAHTAELVVKATQCKLSLTRMPVPGH